MNRQQLLQLFAQRMNLSPDESTALQNGDYERALAGRLQGDPMLVSMLGMMQKTRTVDESEPAPRRSQRSLDEDVEDLQDALQAARTMLRYLAQIMGACRCWGKNRHCPRCQGNGAPGFRASTDPQTFVSWAVPALHALGFQITPAVQTAPSQSDHRAKEE
jgi:hypothetical protein